MESSFPDKVLWKRSQLNDNYVPPSFLATLQRNANVKPYTYSSVALHACAVTQQISSISIFTSIFMLLFDRRLDPRLLASLSLAIFLLGFLCWEFTLPNSDELFVRALRSETIKSSILVLLTLVALSPILRTLTASTSSDSIWPLSAVLLVLSAILNDYGGARRPGRTSERFTSVLSVNAALSASIVLSSRLHDDSSVFALILLSLLVFGQLPMLRNRAPIASSRLKIMLTTGLITATICLASCVSMLHALISCVVLLFVTFGAPQLLIWAQRFKNEIQGPWDVASPVVSTVDR